MNRGITGAIGVIAVVAFVATWGIGLWILIGSGLMPWWIAAGPAIVFGLIGVALINKRLRRSPGGWSAPPEETTHRGVS